MILVTFLLSIIVSIYQSYGSEFQTRGIPLQRASIYNPFKDFMCLDGSSTIPFSYVNDDFCDCTDGTDEPGTSACSNGLFFCTNKGHISRFIPSSFVNDGFCDCCDGSDEYLTSNCTNLCEQLGEEARREAERRSQKISEGARLREQMMAEAKRLLKEKQERVAVLENEKSEAVRLKDEAESLKKTAEERESAVLEEFRAKEKAQRDLKAQEEAEEELKEVKSLFETYDSNGDGVLQVEEVKSRPIFDQNKDTVVTDDEIKFMEIGEINYDTFVEKVWPILKPIVTMSKVKVYPPEEEAWKDNTEEEPNEDNNEEELNDDEIPENGDLENEDEETENKDSYEPTYDEETAKIVEEANQARSHYESTLRTVQDLDRELSHIKEFLSKDYGTDDEFAPLDGQCFTYTDREYSYKLCPFDQVTQMSKSGGSETRLGTWAGWADKEYSTMLYDKGQSCWNGPQRSTRVTVNCGLENEVKSASEPNKCEYVLEFETPAACKLSEKNKDTHDEL
uniref:Glucosidase 2 subunit beta n=1 Tax=Riptortus pedestris TaxID=329032 RepID=R4WR17_RIPPE|nr:glucosidase ii beta subunit [Riptortus pedestris]